MLNRTAATVKTTTTTTTTIASEAPWPRAFLSLLYFTFVASLCHVFTTLKMEQESQLSEKEKSYGINYLLKDSSVMLIKANRCAHWGQ